VRKIQELVIQSNSAGIGPTENRLSLVRAPMGPDKKFHELIAKIGFLRLTAYLQ
jgi:hypothetical protein